MNEITFSQMAMLVTLLGAVIGGANALIAFGDRLWGKKKESGSSLPGQSVACSMQHESFKSSLGEMSDHIRESIQAQGNVAKAIGEYAHAQALRDQKISLELQLVLERISSISRDMRELAEKK